MEATLAAFLAPDPMKAEDEHPQCRYPARYAWLKQRLEFSGLVPEKSCPRFEAWRSQMNPQSVSLVFASYYMNNPASMYGHTFLKFNQAGHAQESALLDYTVNYEAEVPPNDLLYVVRGLAGGYRGHFSTMPYYMKTQQYNNLESRDLWEYPLHLDSGGLDRLVRHLWELGHTSMAYYFFNRNCSYQLMPILEAANPSLNLSSRFRFKAVPADTLRAVLAQPGLAGKPVLRPSYARQMAARRSSLAAPETRVAHDLALPGRFGTAEAALKGLPSDRQALVLDSAYDYFRYRAGFWRDQPPAMKEEEQKLLVLRSRLGMQSPPPLYFENAVSPDAGQATNRLGLGAGISSRGPFEEISARPALHDLEADPTGYLPGSQLEMLNVRARYDNSSGEAHLEELTLIGLESLAGWDPWIHSPSWQLRTGLATARDLDKDPARSLYYDFDLGPGLAYESHLWRRETVYVLADVDTGVGSVFNRGYRWGGGGTSGILLEAASFWRIHFRATDVEYAFGQPGSAVKLSLIQSFSLSHSVELRSTIQRQNSYHEALLSLNVYL